MFYLSINHLIFAHKVAKEYPLRMRRKSLFKPKLHFQAVKQINLTLKQGESIGLDGERVVVEKVH